MHQRTGNKNENARRAAVRHRNEPHAVLLIRDQIRAVGGKDHLDPGLFQRTQFFPHCFLRQRMERRGRFVDQKQVAVVAVGKRVFHQQKRKIPAPARARSIKRDGVAGVLVQEDRKPALRGALDRDVPDHPLLELRQHAAQIRRERVDVLVGKRRHLSFCQLPEPFFPVIALIDLLKVRRQDRARRVPRVEQLTAFILFEDDGAVLAAQKQASAADGRPDPANERTQRAVAGKRRLLVRQRRAQAVHPLRERVPQLVDRGAGRRRLLVDPGDLPPKVLPVDGDIPFFKRGQLRLDIRQPKRLHRRIERPERRVDPRERERIFLVGKAALHRVRQLAGKIQFAPKAKAQHAVVRRQAAMVGGRKAMHGIDLVIVAGDGGQLPLVAVERARKRVSLCGHRIPLFVQKGDQFLRADAVDPAVLAGADRDRQAVRQIRSVGKKLGQIFRRQQKLRRPALRAFTVRGDLAPGVFGDPFQCA